MSDTLFGRFGGFLFIFPGTGFHGAPYQDWTKIYQTPPNSLVFLVKALPEGDFALRYDGEAQGFDGGMASCDNPVTQPGALREPQFSILGTL